MSFDAHLKAQAKFVESWLMGILEEFPESKVRDGMAHALHGGKRLRGFLVLESAALFQIPPTDAVWAASAIEAMHAYSLVHDDLPCMDDDDLRRGQPTVHRKWDEATAVLVGDALQSFAFDLLSQSPGSPHRLLEMVGTLSYASGAAGMVLGQALDIAAESADAPLTVPEITQLQEKKTGALIEWAALAGPRLADADTAALKTYAGCIGLAFQIADDILDVEGDEAKTGKRVKKDAEAGKATFVSHLGLEGAKARARELVAEALDALSIYDARADHLRDAARFVITREF